MGPPCIIVLDSAFLNARSKRLAPNDFSVQLDELYQVAHVRQVYAGMGNFPAIFSAMYCAGNDVALEDKVGSSRSKQQYCRARRALQR